MIVLVNLVNLCMYSGRLVCLNTYRKSSKNEVFNGTKTKNYSGKCPLIGYTCD